MEPNNNNLEKRDKEHVKIVNYFKNNNGIKLQDLESDLILYPYKPGRPYMFSWNQIPGKDNGRLIKYLSRNKYLSRTFGDDKFKTAKIDKIDDGKTIIVSTEKNSLSLKLNQEKTVINMTIEGDRTFEYALEAKMENDELKIYRSHLMIVPDQRERQYDIHCFDKNNNDIVIVEVKSENADKCTFGQLLYYLFQEETFTYPWDLDVNALRGIILAKEIDSSLKELVNKYKNVTPEIKLIEYEGEVEKGLKFKNITLSDDL